MQPKTSNHTEVWAAWPRDARYEVSTSGNVRKQGATVFLKQHNTKDGYRRITQCLPKRVKKAIRVHRMVADAFIPNPDSLPQVNHRDGVKFNNTVDNLEWCTPLQNSRHAYANGLCPVQTGARNNASKLSQEQAIEILRLHREGKNQCAIAELMGVTNSCVHLLVHGKTWPHLKNIKHEHKEAI